MDTKVMVESVRNLAAVDLRDGGSQQRQRWEERSICTGWEPRLLSRVLEAEQAG